MHSRLFAIHDEKYVVPSEGRIAPKTYGICKLALEWNLLLLLAARSKTLWPEGCCNIHVIVRLVLGLLFQIDTNSLVQGVNNVLMRNVKWLP